MMKTNVLLFVVSGLLSFVVVSDDTLLDRSWSKVRSWWAVVLEACGLAVEVGRAIAPICHNCLMTQLNSMVNQMKAVSMVNLAFMALLVGVLATPWVVAQCVRLYYAAKRGIPGAGVVKRCWDFCWAWVTMYKRYVPEKPAEPLEIRLTAEKRAELINLMQAEFRTKWDNGKSHTVVHCADGRVIELPFDVSERAGVQNEKITRAPIRRLAPTEGKVRKGLMAFYLVDKDRKLCKVGSGVRVELRGVGDCIMTNKHVLEEMESVFADGLELRFAAHKDGKLVSVTVSEQMLAEMRPVELGGVDAVRLTYNQTVLNVLGVKKASLSTSRQPGLVTIGTIDGDEECVTSARLSVTRMPFIAAHTGSTLPGWSGSPAYDLKGGLIGIHACAFNGVERNGLVLLNAIYSDAPLVRIGRLTNESHTEEARANKEWFARNYDLGADSEDISALLGDPDATMMMFVDSKGRRGRISREEVQQIQDEQLQRFKDRADDLAEEYSSGTKDWYLETEREQLEEEHEKLEKLLDFEFWDETEEGNIEMKRRARAAADHVWSQLARVRRISNEAMNQPKPRIGYAWSNPQPNVVRVNVMAHGAHVRNGPAIRDVVRSLKESDELRGCAFVDEVNTPNQFVFTATQPTLGASNPSSGDEKRNDEVKVDSVQRSEAPKQGLATEASRTRTQNELAQPKPVNQKNGAKAERKKRKRAAKPKPRAAAAVVNESGGVSVGSEINLASEQNRKLSGLPEGAITGKLRELVDELVRQPTNTLVSKQLQDFISRGSVSRSAPLSH